MDTTALGPPATDRKVAYQLATLLRSDLPGYPTDNRHEQSRHFRGATYLSIRAVYDWFSNATIAITEPSRKRKRVTKSRGTPGQQSRDEDYTPVPLNHLLVELFDRINDVDTVPQFWAQWIVQSELTGNTLIWTPFNANGRPFELWILPTALCYAIPPSNQYPAGAWRVNLNAAGGYMPVMGRLGSAQAILDSREVLHYRHPHPLARWDGMSPLTALSREIDQYDALMESRISAFNHGFTPDAIINLEGASDEMLTSFAADFKNRSAGSKHHRKAFVTNAPKASVTLANTSPREMDFQGSWEQAINVVLAGFGVHPAVAGIVKAGSYAESYSARQHMLDTRIRPIANNYSAFLQKHLARPYFGRHLRVEIDPGSVNDLEMMEKQLAQDGQMGVRTLNEIRTARNLDPVEGGDVPPAVYVQWVTQQTMQPEQPTGPAADPAAAPGQDGPNPLDALGDGILESLGVSAPVQKAVAWDEAKIKRQGGKFAPKGGATGPSNASSAANGKPTPQSTTGATQSASSASSAVPEAVKQHPRVKQAIGKLAGSMAGVAAKVTSALHAVGMTPLDALGTIDDWTRIFVTHHSDAVAHAVGVDAMTAGHILTHLAAEGFQRLKGMIGGGGGKPNQPATVPDPAQTRQDGTDGGPPRPDNPGGAGSLPGRGYKSWGRVVKADVKRETTAHDGKRPGEFAPSGEGADTSGGSGEDHPDVVKHTKRAAQHRKKADRLQKEHAEAGDKLPTAMKELRSAWPQIGEHLDKMQKDIESGDYHSASQGASGLILGTISRGHNDPLYQKVAAVAGPLSRLANHPQAIMDSYAAAEQSDRKAKLAKPGVRDRMTEKRAATEGLGNATESLKSVASRLADREGDDGPVDELHDALTDYLDSPEDSGDVDRLDTLRRVAAEASTRLADRPDDRALARELAMAATTAHNHAKVVYQKPKLPNRIGKAFDRLELAAALDEFVESLSGSPVYGGD